MNKARPPRKLHCIVVVHIAVFGKGHTTKRAVLLLLMLLLTNLEMIHRGNRTPHRPWLL